MTPLFFIAAGLYGLATFLYFTFLFGRDPQILKSARWSLVAAVLAHLAMIGMLCTLKHNPLQDLRGALSLSALLLAAGFLAASFRQRMGVLGAFITPLTLVLLISARLTPQDLSPSEKVGGLHVLGKIHIALSALGVSAFGLAAVVAMIYLLQEGALKGKRIGALYRLAPPLNTLDQLGRRLILIGFPFFTLALISGWFWGARIPGPHVFRIEYLISVITWIIYASLIFARLTVGGRGRRAAWLTVVGFLATLLVLLIYIGRRMLGG